MFPAHRASTLSSSSGGTTASSGAQRFCLRRVDTSYRYRIVNVNSAKCLGITGASTAAGATPEQVPYARVTAQQLHLGAGEPFAVRQNGLPMPPVPPGSCVMGARAHNSFKPEPAPRSAQFRPYPPQQPS